MSDGQIIVLQGQINNLGDRMEKGFAELKTIMTGVEQRLRNVETSEAGSHPIINDRIDNAWIEIKKHADDIKRLDDMVDGLAQTNNILKWLLGVITAIGTATMIKLLFGG